MRASAVIFFALLLLPGATLADAGRINYSTLINSTTLDSIQSFSAISPIDRNAGLQPYGAAELLWLKPQGRTEYDFTFRVALGITTGHRLAPFLEVGTSLFDLIFHADDDDETRDCDSTQDDCDIDVDVKAGLRYQLNREVDINLYYQRIHFGDFSLDLNGNFDIVGAGIGYSF